MRSTVKLYLVQHGEAVAKDIDSDRPLTTRGRRDVTNLRHFFANAGITVSWILHSGKTRAVQTAEILAESLSTPVWPEKITVIDPLDSAPAFVSTVTQWTTDTMLVGHLPFLGKLVSALLTGNENAFVVSFVPGSVVCLERAEDGGWTVGPLRG